MSKTYEASALTRAELDLIKTPVVIEFGAPWCGHCMAAQPHIEGAFSTFASVQKIHHLKIEDGPGRPLGRSFKVKLWPTLIFMKNGEEVSRLVRPGTATEISDALALIFG
ncbi:MAG: thioredoxin family protein [Rhodocyclaceae bacterium]|nr:thioredoxin family protein [Rhodocyclaceae bacterium]